MKELSRLTAQGLSSFSKGIQHYIGIFFDHYEDNARGGLFQIKMVNFHNEFCGISATFIPSTSALRMRFFMDVFQLLYRIVCIDLCRSKTAMTQ